MILCILKVVIYVITDETIKKGEQANVAKTNTYN